MCRPMTNMIWTNISHHKVANTKYVTILCRYSNCANCVGVISENNISPLLSQNRRL